MDSGRRLLEQRQVRSAIEILKDAVKTHPDSGPLARLLAYAYLEDDNDFWALKVLGAHAAKTGDCESMSWIAWIHLRKGELDQAEAVLEQMTCPAGGPMDARRNLLTATLYRFRKEPERALAHLEKARKSRVVLKEDAELLGYLEQSLDPNRLRPLFFGVEQDVGYNSNALMSSVTEGAEEEVDSGFFLGEFEGRLVWPLSRIIRPALEVRARVKSFVETQARDFGFYELGGRAGFILGYDRPRIGLYYAIEDLMLAGGDLYDKGPRWYLEAHRGEFEFEALNWLLVFGGGGSRTFRERARTRTEYDLGAVVQWPLFAGIRAAGIVSGRYYDARIEAYDMLGGSALLSFRIPYYRDGFVRLGALVSLDDYPDSEEYFDADNQRRDILFRALPSIWSPSIQGFRVGLTYRYTDRDSSAEAYAYQAHEVIFKLSWQGSLDPFGPWRTAPEKHVALEYGLSREQMLEERVQDLLREEEAAQQSSSCVE